MFLSSFAGGGGGGTPGGGGGGAAHLVWSMIVAFAIGTGARNLCFSIPLDSVQPQCLSCPCISFDCFTVLREIVWLFCCFLLLLLLFVCL